MSPDIPPVALLVAHRVADYENWKKAFDDHMAARKEAGCLGHHINRGADDSNMVYVYCPASDVERLRVFIDSRDVGEVMRSAGVEGRPAITLMTPKSTDIIPDQKLPGIIVTHAVKDYDAWRAVYDDLNDYRRKSGIVGHAVNQELGNPNRVIVYHQAREMDALRAFLDSTELKEAMQRGGVAGSPDIRFVQVDDFSDY